MEGLGLQRRQHPVSSISSDIRDDISCQVLEEDEEDSFFELELTVPKFDPTSESFVSSDSVEPKQSTEKTQVDPKCNFSQSKRKILPIESSIPRPQTPISLLKSAPKFRVFLFKKSKSASAQEAEKGTQLRNRGRSFFTLRFKLKEIDPALTRDSSRRKNESASSSSETPLPCESNSKRFSKEVMQKYLKLVKPLYVKVSGRQTSGEGFAGEFSPAASPATGAAKREVNMKHTQTGFQAAACRQLGKSKSASASVTGVMSPARRDDSLLQQYDGIEGAILHCKRSFSSSRDLSPLWRSTSAAHEKSQLLDSATAMSPSNGASVPQYDPGT